MSSGGMDVHNNSQAPSADPINGAPNQQRWQGAKGAKTFAIALQIVTSEDQTLRVTNHISNNNPLNDSHPLTCCWTSGVSQNSSNVVFVTVFTEFCTLYCWIHLSAEVGAVPHFNKQGHPGYIQR
jgi:hypothetical protein